MSILQRLSFLIGYGIALAGVAGATALTAWVLHTLGPKPNPIIFFSYILAIMAAAWRGYGPGLFAVALSHFVAPYFLVPQFNPARVEVTRIVLSALVSLLVSWVSATRKRAEQLLRKTNEELEQRVRERTAELERSNAELEQYAYVASHDLQEPLRMMAVYSQLLARRYESELDSTGREFLHVIDSNCRRMLALVDGLLSYSRLIAEEEKQFHPVPVIEIVSEALDNLRAAIIETEADIVYGSLPTVECNREDLVRVFQNLVSNAIKYHRPDEPPLILIDASADVRLWTFSVRDNGIGLDMQYAGQIFKVFKRLHGRDIPGTGIGLAICKKIVEDHGGQIWVESALGQGATFRFTIPFVRSDGQENKKHRLNSKTAPARSRQKSKRSKEAGLFGSKANRESSRFKLTSR